VQGMHKLTTPGSEYQVPMSPLAPASAGADVRRM